jgi:hypothetical protein
VRRLVTIPIGHYCEKAPWALGRAGIDYIWAHPAGAFALSLFHLEGQVSVGRRVG